MPCRSAGAGGGQPVAQCGQPTDHGRPRPARARVRGDADRLVHHDDVVVAVEDVEPGDHLGRPGDVGRRRRARAARPPARRRRAAGRTCRRPGRRAATRPSSASPATTVRDIPSSRDSPASTRMPSSPSGTGSSRCHATGGLLLSWSGCRPARGRQRQQHQQDPAAAHRRVGRVEHRGSCRPGEQRHHVHDVPAQRAGRAEQPVDQVAHRAAEHQPQRRPPSRWSAAAGRPEITITTVIAIRLRIQV